MNNNNYSTDTQIDRNRGTTALERQVAAQQRNERMSFFDFRYSFLPFCFLAQEERETGRERRKKRESQNAKECGVLVCG